MDFDHPPASPLDWMRAWLAEAWAEPERPNPNSMTLATVDPDGRPSARTVLLKDLDEHGAVFFTNRDSRKGRALAAHPRATLVLHWDRPGRQLIIEGPVTPTDDATSDRYFASRPRGSQIGAWASAQSRQLDDRAMLEAAAADIERRFAGQNIPRPRHWGGHRVALERVELWRSRDDRLHDRIVYHAQDNGGWRWERLWP